MQRFPHHAPCGERTVRIGITLVEVIVSIAILGVLVAILLPAVGKSRRVADTVTCRARMSEIGRATLSFEGRTKRYPHGTGSLTWHFELLPDLDQTDLFRQLMGKGEGDSKVLYEIAATTRVAVLQCPSDPKSASFKYLTNYLQNGGSTFLYCEEIDSHAFNTVPLSSRDVTDGLSMTAYVAEQMNEFLAKSSDRRGYWRTPTVYGLPNQLDLFADQCESMPNGAAGGPYELGPHTYFKGTILYNHIVRPNQATCRNGSANGSSVWALTTNSMHDGGVHVLMADGAVRFVNDNVARVVWRGIGTRNGNETITLP